MNPQEREMLSNFLRQLTEMRATQKDAEAEALIREACARQPDAEYLLVQRAMQLDYVLNTQKDEVQKLKRELEEARGSGTRGGFLNDPNAWGSTPSRASSNVSVTGQPLPPPAMPGRNAPAGVSGAAAGAAPGRQGSGLLGNVAATAAGVVAGSFLFQGIQNLMGDRSPDAASNAAQLPPQSNVAANEYSDSSLDELGAGEDSFDVADSGFDGGDFA